jgi:hypothetical protein
MARRCANINSEHMLVVTQLRARIGRASNTKPHQLRRFAVVGLKDRESKMFGRGSFSRMSFGRMVIWTRGNLVLVSRSNGGRVIWSQEHLVARSFGRESLSRMPFRRRVIWSRSHLDTRSISCVIIRSHGYLVAGHLVAGHLAASNWRSGNKLANGIH